MPSALPKRNKAEGKSLPAGAPTERGSRSKVMRLVKSVTLNGLSQRLQQRFGREIGADSTQ